MGRYENKKDEELIAALRAGDIQIIDYLMEKYKNLVRKKAKAMYLLGGDNDDLIQEGMIGLFKAIRDYQKEKETSFFAFAELCITRQMYSAVQASRRKKHIPLNSYISLNESSYEEEEGMTFGEVLESIAVVSPEEEFIDRESVQDIEEKIEKNLSRFEQEVLNLYLAGLSYHQIATLLNKPVKSTDNALQRAKNKLSVILEKKEE